MVGRRCSHIQPSALCGAVRVLFVVHGPCWVSLALCGRRVVFIDGRGEGDARLLYVYISSLPRFLIILIKWHKPLDRDDGLCRIANMKSWSNGNKRRTE